jgi:Flp pilus assembly protein TadD
MTYSLLFQTREGQVLSSEDIRNWFHTRKGYTVDSEQATFLSEDTGFTFTFGIPAERSENTVATFSVNVPAPEVIVEEIEREAGAFANHFNLSIWDEQVDGGAFGPHNRERMLRDFTKHNRYAYSIYYGHMNQKPEASVTREVWNRVWQWNSKAKGLGSDNDSAPFIPKIMLIQLGKRTATAIALPAPIEALIPEVDYIITAQFGPISFESIKPALENMKQEQEPLPHWKIAPVPKAFEEAFNSATKAKGKLAMLPAQKVVVAELVEEVLDELKQQAKEREFMQQAAKAYNTAQFKEALKLCNKIKGEYAQMALMLRGVTQGELAKYKECLTDLATYLESDNDNEMVWNVYGYFLSSLDKKADGEKAYVKAIELIDAKLEQEPNSHDLWSRKAYGLLGLNRAKDALSAARKGLEINDSDALLAQHCGRAHMYLDQWEEAKTWLEKAITLDEYNPYARFYLTKVLTHLGDKAGANVHAAYVKKVSPHLSPNI